MDAAKFDYFLTKQPLPPCPHVSPHRCGNVRLLPEERALNSMYELCVLSGNYAYALQVDYRHPRRLNPDPNTNPKPRPRPKRAPMKGTQNHKPELDAHPAAKSRDPPCPAAPCNSLWPRAC
eukprot:scaffold3330_cov128-Isochrysis_galbana.AAC.7